MKVRAKEYGQYQGRMRETGEIFEIKDGDLAPWMEKVMEVPPVVSEKPSLTDRISHGDKKEK